MTSKVQGNKRNRQGNREALEKKLRSYSCIGTDRENGGKFHTFYKKEIAELLPKNVERTVSRGPTVSFLDTFNSLLLKPKGLKTVPFGAAH